MPKPGTVSEKLARQLLLWGFLMLPFAYLADSVLDAIIFGERSLWSQLLYPDFHELAIRLLFSIFIMAAIGLGLHHLSRVARIEKVFRHRNEDLALANLELEQFNLSLAGDLRNSLTDLCASLALLKAQCSEQQDEKTRFLSEKVYTISETLEAQIGPMMKLAAIASGDLQRENVKLDALVLGITDDLLSTYTKSHIDVKVQSDLSAWCDPKLMHLALENLLSNALKFIPGERPCQIEFGRLKQQQKTVFYLRDNGVGFDEEQATHIFDTFHKPDDQQNLTSREISLAAVRRVIKRHGGEIWAEGEPDIGATFYFTL
jgi:light-regulated signal transduction histidine kinase (bacteriophytochrome)